eukprot:1663460-Alexandrium_andersonii.AAC.1
MTAAAAACSAAYGAAAGWRGVIAHGPGSAPAPAAGAAAAGGSASGGGPKEPLTGSPLESTTAPSLLSQRRGASERAACPGAVGSDGAIAGACSTDQVAGLPPSWRRWKAAPAWSD